VEAGKCNQFLGQYEEAIAHYEIALDKNKDDNKLSA
jgi:tetratricopeptide (TPR) repeat protein